MFEDTFSRRNLFVRSGAVAVAGSVGLGAGLGVSKAEADTPALWFSDDFTSIPDGPLNDRIAATGQKWLAYGASAPAMAIYKHAIGPPAGFTPPKAGAVAGYGSVDLGGVATRVGALYHWDTSASAATSLCLGSFDYSSTPVGGGPAGANMHLAISPTFLQFAVFSRGAANDFTVLTPRGGRSGTVSFPKAQVRDGKTTYQALVHLTGDVARVDLTGLSAPLYFQDPRIAAVKANNPFFEYYATPGGTDLPRFTLVAAGN